MGRANKVSLLDMVNSIAHLIEKQIYPIERDTLLWDLVSRWDWHRRLSKAKVEEGMGPRHINGLAMLGCMVKQGVKQCNE